MNIILLISDTFRYDNLFDRADMPVRTPHLDRFAARAVSVERFYTGSFPTIPQRTDLTMGRHGWPWYGWQPVAASGPNSLPRMLAEKQYATQLICDCPHLFNAGFQQTFHGACQVRGQEGDRPFLRMNHPIEDVMPDAKTRTGGPSVGPWDANLANLHRWTNRNWRGEEDRFPPRTARLAVEWLEENYRFEPVFLWVDFFDPHEPWDPPEYMVRRYDPDYSDGPMIHPNYGRSDDYTAGELRNLRAHYCAEAELVDRWVGRILEKIDDLDLWENSIVIFTTDHGMSLGDHARTGKTNINEGDDRYWPIYPEIAHIPFMVAAPGLEGGRSVDAIGQPADITPTLLDLAGLECTPDEPFHGRSLAPLLRGETDEPVRDVAVSASCMRQARGPGLPACATTPMLYTERWAYTPVGVEGAPELFDLDTDPGATANVAQAHGDTVADLHERLMRWLAEVEAPADTVAVIDQLRPA